MHAVKLLFLFAAIASGASAADITGTWKAVFVNGDAPKTAGEVILDLRADGGKLKGVAHVGTWPGDAPVIDGKLEGDRISFTVYGNSPWWAESASGGKASGLPKLTFVGTAQGNEMQFTLTWDSVMLYGKPTPGREFLLKATRTAK